MTADLIFTSAPIEVRITNYVKHTFRYNDWVISDKYVPHEGHPSLCKYSIIVTKNGIVDEEMLYKFRTEGQDVINLITSLIPFCKLPSLNRSKYLDFENNISLIDYKIPPKGWKTNYIEIKEKFEAVKNSILKVTISSLGLCKHHTIEDSPLEELELMMKRYDSVPENVKYLIYLNYSILTTTSLNVYMLIGKALEIIDAMYPKGRGKEDNRIAKLFPELKDVFHNYTIGDLMGLSNFRKETRHYIENKTNLTPHPSLNKEERKKMFRCATCLLLNVIREKFGLSHQTIIFEQ